MPEGTRKDLENHPSPTGNSRKPIFLKGKLFLEKKQKTEDKKFSKLLENFLMKVSGNSHNTENLEKSFTLAKRFVSCKT